MRRRALTCVAWALAVVCFALVVIGVWVAPITPAFTLTGHLFATAGEVLIAASAVAMAAVE